VYCEMFLWQMLVENLPNFLEKSVFDSAAPWVGYQRMQIARLKSGNGFDYLVGDYIHHRLP
jgi:hypothetical protein